jgi:hypothetical protein
MPAPIFLVLTLAFGALGFFAGSAIIGALEFFRNRPRYLMTGGAAAFLAGVVLGRAIHIEALFYFPVIFLMMGGIGLLLAGWESEKEWQEDRAEVHRLRMEHIRRQMAVRKPDILSEDAPNGQRSDEAPRGRAEEAPGDRQAGQRSEEAPGDRQAGQRSEEASADRLAERPAEEGHPQR